MYLVFQFQEPQGHEPVKPLCNVVPAVCIECEYIILREMSAHNEYRGWILGIRIIDVASGACLVEIVIIEGDDHADFAAHLTCETQRVKTISKGTKRCKYESAQKDR